MKKFLLIGSLLLGSFLIAQCKKDKAPQNIIIPVPVDSLAFTDAEKGLIFNGGKDSLMYIMNYFVHHDSLVLRSHSRNVNLNDTTTLFHLINRMYVTVKDPHNTGVGIAAPQLGICRNIIWVQRYDKGPYNNHPFEVYLNPRIIRYSDTTEFMPDGCLSIPGISGNSKRAIWVNIDYDLKDGTHHSEHISQKYTAHIFQHEIDHLNGILFIDRLQ